MSKWTTILMASITLAVIPGLIWIAWGSVGDEISRDLLDPELHYEVAQGSLPALKQDLARIGLVFWAIGSFFAVLWLIFSSFAKVLSPADVFRQRKWWLVLCVFSAIVALIYGYYEVVTGVGDLRDDVRMVVPPLLLLSLTVTAFWLIGSFFFTRLSMRPAVPGALFNRISRGMAI